MREERSRSVPSGAPSGATRITLLFDGDCPFCSREVQMLRRLDRSRGRVAFQDIAAPGFDLVPSGRSLEELMARIHGVLPDGRVVEGVEVFRRAYAAVGLGWLLAPTGWPVLRPVADAAYRWFARNRLRLSGRAGACTTERCGVHLQAGRADAREAACRSATETS